MTQIKRESVVITGLGLVLPCGDGVEAARQSWASRASCFAELPAHFGPGRGAACTSFNPAGVIPPMQLRRLDRPSRFAWAASHQAFLDAGLDPRTGGNGQNIGIAVGTLTGGSEASEAFLLPYLEKGPAGASPMVFPNCVANAASGHVALAFDLNGPCTTQLEREGSTMAALDQACRWLRRGMADAVLVIGTDGLFPLQMELLQRTGRTVRSRDPVVGEGTGYLPGEGAQAFLLETRSRAESRGARIRAEVDSVVGVSPLDGSVIARAEALAIAVSEVLAETTPTAWIGGSNGSSRLDALEASLSEQHPHWPVPGFPKLLWGEFCGAGGQLLAAALLQEAESVLVSAPSSSGAQYAVLLRDVRV